MTPWEELQNECLQCRACPLADTRQNVVFGTGRADAEVLFKAPAPMKTSRVCPSWAWPESCWTTCWP